MVIDGGVFFIFPKIGGELGGGAGKDLDYRLDFVKLIVSLLLVMFTKCQEMTLI